MYIEEVVRDVKSARVPGGSVSWRETTGMPQVAQAKRTSEETWCNLSASMTWLPSVLPAIQH